MARRIKLGNILHAGFDSDTGDTFMNVTEEYVCEGCRHLVAMGDKFCWQCGEALEQSNRVEHYFEGEKITNKEFKEKVNGDIK